jgi:hypothetical protein
MRDAHDDGVADGDLQGLGGGGGIESLDFEISLLRLLSEDESGRQR